MPLSFAHASIPEQSDEVLSASEDYVLLGNIGLQMAQKGGVIEREPVDRLFRAAPRKKRLKELN